MKKILQIILKEKYLLLSFFLALLASWPLFHSGLIPTHDGEYHLIRFYEFDKTLRSGVLYPRWAPDLFFGYGIPLLTYVYPLPNYIASLFHLFGTSFLDSVKLNMVAATLTGSILLYLWTKRFWGNFGAMISSIFYTFSPYHFVDIYVRGSVGEVWALGLFPGFLWAYTEFVKTKKPGYAIAASIFLALTIFSHNILGLMFFFFAVTYVLFLLFIKGPSKEIALSSLLIFILSLGMSAIFWIPALFETRYVQGLQVYDILRNFPDMSQLLFPSWGTDFFGSGNGNEMSVQIGVVNLIAFLIGVVASTILWKQKKQQMSITLGFFLFWFLLSVFLMLPMSYFLWKAIPLIHYFQFPWRFLSTTILICSFLAGSIAMFKKTLLVGWALVILAVVTTISYTIPAYYMIRADTYYTTRSNFIDGTNSVGNQFNTIWSQTKTKRPNELFIIDKGQTVTSLQKKSPTTISAIITTTKPVQQVVSLSYFPGWEVRINNTPVTVFNKNGLIAFAVPSGKQAITIHFGTTALQKFAAALSLISVFLLFFLLRKKSV